MLAVPTQAKQYLSMIIHWHKLSAMSNDSLTLLSISYVFTTLMSYYVLYCIVRSRDRSRCYLAWYRLESIIIVDDIIPRGSTKGTPLDKLNDGRKNSNKDLLFKEGPSFVRTYEWRWVLVDSWACRRAKERQEERIWTGRRGQPNRPLTARRRHRDDSENNNSNHGVQHMPIRLL